LGLAVDSEPIVRGLRWRRQGHLEQRRLDGRRGFSGRRGRFDEFHNVWWLGGRRGFGGRRGRFDVDEFHNVWWLDGNAIDGRDCWRWYRYCVRRFYGVGWFYRDARWR
jgi:hypothetical protein